MLEQQLYWRGQMSVSRSVYRSSINTRNDWLAVHSTLLINSLYAPAEKQEVIHCLTSQLTLKADGWWGVNKGAIHPKHWSCGQTARDKRRVNIKEEFTIRMFPDRILKLKIDELWPENWKLASRAEAEDIKSKMGTITKQKCKAVMVEVISIYSDDRLNLNVKTGRGERWEVRPVWRSLFSLWV